MHQVNAAITESQKAFWKFRSKAQDKFKIKLSEAALFHIFKYFNRKEQLKLLRINQWVYSMIVKFQNSKQFGVVYYYTREYTDVLKLHRAR